MRLLICGDRNWENFSLIYKHLALEKALHDELVVIEGGAKGADTLARKAATVLGIPVLEYKAQWDRYGRAAGPVRNQEMLDVGKPDLVWAFHNDLERSKGTKDMVTRAENAGVLVEKFKEE